MFYRCGTQKTMETDRMKDKERKWKWSQILVWHLGLGKYWKEDLVVGTDEEVNSLLDLLNFSVQTGYLYKNSDSLIHLFINSACKEHRSMLGIKDT